MIDVDEVLSPSQQQEPEGAAAAAAAARTRAAAKTKSRFPRVASWSALIPRVGSFSSLSSAAAAAATTAGAGGGAAAAGRRRWENGRGPAAAPAAGDDPLALRSPERTAAEPPVPVDEDIDAWPNDPEALAAATAAAAQQEGGGGEGGGIDYRFLSRHLHGAEVEGRHVSEASIQQDYHDVKILAADERLLLAQALWVKVDAYLESRAVGELGPNARAVREAVGRPRARRRLADLQRKVAVCHEAFRDLGSLDGWTFAQKLLGVTTHYKLHREDGTITIRIQGELTGCSVFDQLAILREADLFKLWMPFMVGSQIVKEVNKTELVFHSTLSVPWIATRDAVVHLFACDHTEQGLLLVCGESVPEPPQPPSPSQPPANGTSASPSQDNSNNIEEDDKDDDGLLGGGALWGRVPGLRVPPRLEGWNADRMVVRDFRAQLRIDSPTACRLDVVANIEPKVPLPQPIINFGTRKLAGMLLFYLQKHARRIAQDPLRNPHARRMRRCKFYRDYFISRILAICLDKGWDLGPVPVFEASGLEAEDEEDEEDEENDENGGFSGGAKTLARDTRRVWAAERAKFERALQAKRERRARARLRQRHAGLLHHLSPVLSLGRGAAGGGGGSGRIAAEEQEGEEEEADAAAAPTNRGRTDSFSAGRTPLLAVTQAFSSLTGAAPATDAEPDEEELEEAEEDAAELLALAASWSSLSSGRGLLPVGAAAAGAADTTKPQQEQQRSTAAAAVALVTTTASTLLAALRRLLPLLLLGGGLPWLFHHHTTPIAPSQTPLPLAHQCLALLASALLRQLGVALAAPRSRALRRGAFLLSFAFLLAAMAALLWAAYKPVLLTNPARPVGLVLVPRRRRPKPSPATTASSDVWVRLQRVETLYLPLLLWLYGEARRGWRKYLRRRRRLWEEWGYAFGGPPDGGGAEAEWEGRRKPHVE